MTLQAIYERVHQVFPKVTVAQVTEDANRITEEFCEESDTLRKSGDLTLTTAVSYSLPADCLHVFEVIPKDADGDTLDDELTYTIKDGTIYFADEYGEVLDAWPTDVVTLTIRYAYSPTAMALVTSSPTIANKWHRAIIAKLLAEYHAEFGDAIKASLYEKRYLGILYNAKRSAKLAQWKDPDINIDRENF